MTVPYSRWVCELIEQRMSEWDGSNTEPYRMWADIMETSDSEYMRNVRPTFVNLQKRQFVTHILESNAMILQQQKHTTFLDLNTCLIVLNYIVYTHMLFVAASVAFSIGHIWFFYWERCWLQIFVIFLFHVILYAPKNMPDNWIIWIHFFFCSNAIMADTRQFLCLHIDFFRSV